LRRRGVEENLVVRIVERLVEIGRPARDIVALRQRLGFLGIPADQDRIRHHPGAI
jgi:hypothetical protein